jgi:isopenicillin-N epimerase
MTGAMVAVRVPGAHEATRESAYALHERLQNDHRVQVPVLAIGGALWVRVSAQVYNDMDDYERLADALS